jgi:hypothetical protein
MIYFDRIEVVNILSASSGKYLQIFVILNSIYCYIQCILKDVYFVVFDSNSCEATS